MNRHTPSVLTVAGTTCTLIALTGCRVKGTYDIGGIGPDDTAKAGGIIGGLVGGPAGAAIGQDLGYVLGVAGAAYGIKKRGDQKAERNLYKPPPHLVNNGYAYQGLQRE